MLEKYLNKEVKVLIRTPGIGLIEKEDGIITSIDDKFIELDNKQLINIFSILQIKLK